MLAFLPLFECICFELVICCLFPSYSLHIFVLSFFPNQLPFLLIHTIPLRSAVPVSANYNPNRTSNVAALLAEQGDRAEDESNLPFTQVLSYQKHRSSLKNIKPGITLSAPWQPTFSLSKRCNKYHRCTPAITKSSLTKSSSKMRTFCRGC
jgi:hypothetical protein